MARATNDLVRLYLQEIGRYPLLAPSDEMSSTKQVYEMLKIQSQQQAMEQQLNREPTDVELATALGKTSKEIHSILAQGQRAKERLVTGNLRLVVAIAKKYQNRNVEFLDLIQEGTLGLARGIEKFDPNKGYKLSTYAYWWITQSVTRAIAEKGRTIRLPVHIHERLNQIKKAQRELSQSLGRKPTVAEIAESLEIKPDKLREYIEHSRRPTSLDMRVGQDSDSELWELLPSDEAPLFDQLHSCLMRENVRQLLECLTPVQRQIISLRFGLDNDQQLSLTQISHLLPLSRERIRQIEHKAIAILRRQGRNFNN